MPDQDDFTDTPDNRYSNHGEQLEAAKPPSERLNKLQHALQNAFAAHIIERATAFIQFDQISVEELGQAFASYPIIIKSILTCVNVAGRAMARDLNLNVDTYGNKISKEKAFAIAGYIKPMLPKEIAIPALAELDRWFWVDKGIRATKGNWEKEVTRILNEESKIIFKKRKFTCDNQEFELDAAYPTKGNDIQIGIDVKRIESRRDIHKRSDEIINKATKFKKVYPNGQFFAVVYYPFPSEQLNVSNRLKSLDINNVYFASETPSSIQAAAELLLSQLNRLKEDSTINQSDD